MKRAYAVILILVITACARPQATGINAINPNATTESVFIATMRSQGQTGQIYGQKRSEQMHYAEAFVSVPPIHQIGRLERGTGVVNTAKHFAPLGHKQLPDIRALSSHIAASQANTQEPLLIFVHGYNNTLEDTVFRLAQIQHDFELQNPALLFSWPSAGDPRGYVYDRDSVLFARSDLARLLEGLQRSGQRRILVLAHSMGSHLVMEALRQLKLQGKTAPLSAIEGVVMMSPDIDPDVFRKQAREIGTLPQPFVIMTTQNDHVLNLAGLLSGRKERLGRIQNADEVAGLGVTVLDFSSFENGENFGHMVPVSSPEAIAFLRKLSGGISQSADAFSRYLKLGDSPKSAI